MNQSEIAYSGIALRIPQTSYPWISSLLSLNQSWMSTRGTRLTLWSTLWRRIWSPKRKRWSRSFRTLEVILSSSKQSSSSLFRSTWARMVHSSWSKQLLWSAKLSSCWLSGSKMDFQRRHSSHSQSAYHCGFFSLSWLLFGSANQMVRPTQWSWTSSWTWRKIITSSRISYGRSRTRILNS